MVKQLFVTTIKIKEVCNQAVHYYSEGLEYVFNCYKNEEML